jgi:GrpB-like predicted nucleotidyltransferase (UPF0157 family)
MTPKGTWRLPLAAEPVTDEYLASITIGDRKPLNDRVLLAEYDPGWPSMYSEAESRIRLALSDRALQLEHVGSTAMPGLCAKPIIDIVLAVEDSADELSYVPALQDQGFFLRVREPDWYQHRFLVDSSNAPKWQLHVFSAGCEEIERMLAFRDWLRENDQDRQRYETVKRELAARRWKHVAHYADAKANIVREILARAQRSTTSTVPTRR